MPRQIDRIHIYQYAEEVGWGFVRADVTYADGEHVESVKIGLASTDNGSVVGVMERLAAKDHIWSASCDQTLRRKRPLQPTANAEGRITEVYR